MENYFAAACVQIALDLLGCLLLAGFVRRIAPAGAGRGAALARCGWRRCARSLRRTRRLRWRRRRRSSCWRWPCGRWRDSATSPRWGNALWFTFAVTCAALLRPDGALAAVAFAPVLFLWLGGRRHRITRQLPGDLPDSYIASGGEDAASTAGLETGGTSIVRMAVVCVLLALAPFAVWTARNWSVFHVFEPLAPRLATDPGESINPGWERWVKSWCLDFISTYEIYWNVPGDKLDVSELPNRAFDTPAQYAETAALAADYNSHGMELTPQIDAGFARLAEERIAAHPLRYYCVAAAGPGGRYVAAAARGEPEHRSGLVGLRASSRGDGVQLGLRGVECALFASRDGRAVPAAAVLGRAAGVYAAAQRVAADRGSAGDALHAGVLPDAVCAGRSGAGAADATGFICRS